MFGGGPSSAEQVVYIGLAAFLALSQILGLALHAGAADYLRLPATSLLRYLFGFDQLGHLGVALALCWYALLAVLLVAFHRNKAAWLESAREIGRFMTSPLGSLAWALVSMGLFFLLRNEFVNQDGRAFAARFLADVPTKGAHITHDEMWELYIHSKFWLWTTMRYGWSVIQSYQFLSAIAGGVFVFLLIRTCALVLPGNPLVLFLGIASGGFMQLFFGDVENYTMTAALILLYLLLALLHLKGRLPLVAPSAALAVAITFHLLAGFLLPSLAYLVWGQVRRDGWRSVGLGLSVFAGIIIATLVFFAFHNLPITDFFTKSHAFGHGGHILLMLARPSPLYYWQHLNLMALLFPGFILLFPLLAFKRIPWDPTNIFLAIATLFLLALQLTWKAQLGVYYDWNLFAAGAIPFSLLVWRNVLANVSFPLKAETVAVVIALAGAHTLAWIISNRFSGFL
jgi:hypothetical protein